MKLLIPVLFACALLGAFAGFTASASPVPADRRAPIVSASPVEADDAPAAAPARAVDAGPATGIGTSPIVLPDPVEDPGGFGGVALDAARAGRYALFAVLALLGLSRGLIYAADKWPSRMGWAGGKATRPLLVMAGGILASSAASLIAVGSVDMRAVAGAIAAAIALELKATPAAKIAPESLGGGK